MLSHIYSSIRNQHIHTYTHWCTCSSFQIPIYELNKYPNIKSAEQMLPLYHAGRGSVDLHPQIAVTEIEMYTN